jgi:segregation and condensation protein B
MNKIKELEAFLFIKGEPQLKKDILSVLDINEDILLNMIKELSLKYENSGISLLETDNELSFGTSKDVSSFIEKMEREERGGELSKASLETLTIILYKNGASRTEIDYIRGVNSSFILRNLYLRGLITKKECSSRSPTYIPTVDLLGFLGISNITDLPEQDILNEKLNELTRNE